MAITDEPPLRDLADRTVRQALPHPDNLRAFLEAAVPQLAAGFDCHRAVLLDREFPLDDWRRREADLPFEIPYRMGAEEIVALVVVLIEHQSDTDPLMPLRMLYFAVTYWDKQWHAWEQLDKPRPPLRLRPVLPLVLYTGDRPWGSNRTLVDLLGEPQAFHAFAPAWQPLFWNLADHTPEALLQTGKEWLQTLAVIRAQDEEADEFAAVFAATVQRLAGLQGRNRVRWYDLMRIVISYATWRRPQAERDALLSMVQAAVPDPAVRKEIEAMKEQVGLTIAEMAWAKGKAEGEAKGKAEGEAKGKVEGMQQMLLLQARKRFGEPDPGTRSALQAITDPARLERLSECILEVTSWTDLLQTL